ncbi:MAG TPA: histidine phosphatase family protein [Ramlibacter sp.]|nr:histidine phosphatase family protein [Ramlibacter sp.]
MTTELILIRHGETEWNRQLRFQGQVDVALNDTGREQARRVAERLRARRVDALVSSDLLRAVQTADPSALARGLPLTVDSGLREQSFGAVDGLSVDEIQATQPQAWAGWLRFDADYRMPGGESARQFHARVTQALSLLARANAGRALAVVTHGGVLDMVWRSAQGLPLDGPRECDIPNGGLNTVRFDHERGAFEIVDWAEAAHLAGMPAQPHYDQKKLLATLPNPKAA